jgi:outer membrane protein OmpA-like peptidoglycan-associated protein
MKTHKLLILVGCAGLLGSCSSTVPKELVDARAAYQRVSTSPTARIAPAEVHVAGKALAKAEQAFADDPESYQTRDLSYIAQRKAQLADATAQIALAKKSQAQAAGEYEVAQQKVVSSTKDALSNKNAALAESRHQQALTNERMVAAEKQTATKLAAEQEARVAAERRATEAQTALANLAAVREERRGMVITLSGGVLFASNQSALLPHARTQLGKVAVVLLKNGDRRLTIEGHTDSRGSASHNMDLSQRRADSVLSYLQQRGYEASRMTARGLGEGRPVADNKSAEGRANNRRVEIVVNNLKTSSR